MAITIFFSLTTDMAEIADKYNYQNLVRIFGIPANFSKYQTQEGKNLTEELVLQRIGTQLNKKLSLKKIRQVYQDWSSDYLRPPLVAEFYSHKEKLSESPFFYQILTTCHTF